MPYLLLGPDSYSKEIFISNLVLKNTADLVVFTAENTPPDTSVITQTDMFSKNKVFWFQGFVPEFILNLPDLAKSKNRIVITLQSLDKRKKENKELLASEKVEVKEFILPHGRELDSWIFNRVVELGGSISKQATDKLAQAIGRDSGKEIKAGPKVISTEEIFDLWQAESEIKKLLALANGQEISEDHIRELVPENREVDVFQITNAFADGKKSEAINLLHAYLKNQTGSEEKGSVIQLNALLAEQFRNVGMIAGFVSQNKTESEILELTGWKPGRLFVIKKAVARYPLTKILDCLNKLKALDVELKSSSVPPKVLLDLIISQLFA